MTLSNYVSLTITRDSVGLARPGFGVPLMLSSNAAWSGDRVRSYNSLVDLEADFATTTVEYLCAAALFGQNPKLETLKIARCALPPTQRYSISVGTPVNSHVYVVNVVGEGFSGTATTAASDSSASNDEVVALLVTALNGIAGNNYTASAVGSVGSQTVQIVADDTTSWFSLEIHPDDIENLSIAQNHADPGVATDLAAIQLEDPDWYFLVTNYNSKAYVAAAETWVEANKKLYLWDANDTTCATVAVASADDTFEDAFDAALGRASGWYSPRPHDFLAASTIGRCAPLDPGKVTFALKTLSGPEEVRRTATHRQNILARNANSYERVTPDRVVTYLGTVFSGEYIDVVRDLDFVESDMILSIFEVLIGSDKLPYTDPGFARIEAAMRAVLARAESAGIFAPGWTVTVPTVASQSVSDRSNRIARNFKFNATLAGAVHKAVVIGVVSV